jgi:hypothetical protein
MSALPAEPIRAHSAYRPPCGRAAICPSKDLTGLYSTVTLPPGTAFQSHATQRCSTTSSTTIFSGWTQQRCRMAGNCCRISTVYPILSLDGGRVGDASEGESREGVCMWGCRRRSLRSGFVHRSASAVGGAFLVPLTGLNLSRLLDEG